MRTAVAAPDAFDDLFAFIDTMTVVEVLRFTLKFQWWLLGRMIEGSDL